MKKPKPITVETSVHDGRLEWSARVKDQIRAALKLWGSRPVVIEIRPWEETRRARANAFYWLAIGKVVAYERAEGFGADWSTDDWHERLKLAFNSKTLVDPSTGEEMRIAQSTAKLSVEDFSAYLEQCLLLFAERYGLVIEPTKSEDWRDREAA